MTLWDVYDSDVLCWCTAGCCVQCLVIIGINKTHNLSVFELVYTILLTGSLE